MLDWLQKLININAFLLCIKVLVQYGERRKVLVLSDTFASVVKKEFDIDSEETIVLQGFDEEWGEYLDIEEVDLLPLKDKTKLRVVLKEKVSIQVLLKKFLFKTFFLKRHFMNCKNSILKARFVLPLATPEIKTRNHQGLKLFYIDLYFYHLCLNTQK